MERTISGMLGKGSVSHNTRTFSAKNVDKERSCNNIEFCNSDIKEIYHQLFDGALERFNAKQKRSDRKIDNYYEKIRHGKQEKLFHEVIFQIGNKDDMNVKSAEGELAREILSEYMKQFQGRNPNLSVFSAHLHMDEETPHIHIDFVPFVCNSKRGLDTRVSLKGALAEQGFSGGTRGATEWNQWIESEKKELSRVMERFGIKWKQLGTHNKHLSVIDFEKQERQKEVVKLEQVVTNSHKELEDIRQENVSLASQNNLLEESKEKLKADNEQLQKKQEKLQQNIEQMAKSKTALERNVRIYDEDNEWQLPEASALMSAKTYRDNKAARLVYRLKELVKNLTIKCVQFMEEIKRLTTKVARQDSQIKNLTDRIVVQEEKVMILQEKALDLERVKRFVGSEKVTAIVEQTRKQEQAEIGDKQAKREKMYR